MTIDTNINKTICPYPWIHSYIGSHYEKKLCCIADDIDEFKKVPTKEFWNSDYMKTVRLNMLSGQKNDTCHTCYELEELGIKTLRLMASEAYVDRDFDELFKTNKDGSINKNPEYFDYRTIYCNLQCISCGWTYSSKHISLHNKMWYGDDDNPNKIILNIDKEFEKVMLQEIIDSIRNKVCKNIYWAGGEPMLSHIHWGVISEMRRLRTNPEYTEYIEHGLQMHYNTNLTQLTYKNNSIPQLLEFNQPSIQASLDGTHETFEYTRDGAKWVDVEKNWHEYYKYLNKYKLMGIASVLHAPVIIDIDRWFDFFEQFDLLIYNHRYFHMLDMSSAFLDVCLFPKHIFDRVVGHAIERFENSSMRNAENSVAVLQSYIQERERNIDHYNNPESAIKCKAKTIFRDRYLITKRPFHEVLKIVDKEAYEWYQSIPKGI